MLLKRQTSPFLCPTICQNLWWKKLQATHPLFPCAFGLSALHFIVWLRSQSSNSFIGSRHQWLSVCKHVCDVWAHLLYMSFFFCCLYCFIGCLALCVCFQLIEVVTTHPFAPSLSHNHKHTCVVVSLDDPVAEPDSSIPVSLARV